jgi:RNA polymerase sigma-70 factor (ECF subfamily)
LRYRAGDEAAAAELFPKLESVFRGFYNTRMAGSQDIADMVQTTLLKVHFGRNSFDEKLSLKTWVFTIANRALIDHWRVGSKDKENLLDIDQEDEEAGQGIESIAHERLSLEEFVGMQKELTEALKKLKPLERSIVYLYGVEEMSMKEIATIHESTEGAMKVRVHRAFAHLRTLL